MDDANVERTHDNAVAAAADDLGGAAGNIHGCGGPRADRTVVRLPTAAASEATTLISVIDRAIATGADIDQIERMYALYERASARAAKSSFTAALMQAKALMPKIIKTGTIEGNVKDDRGAKVGKAKQSTYAKWEEVCAQIEPVLAANDLVLTFETAQPAADRVSVTAVITHVDGHAERSQLALPIDTGGAKNNVQGWGSSVSYGKRYAAFALLNLVGHDDKDTDGVPPSQFITEEQEATLRDLLEATEADLPKFCGYFKIEKLPDLKASDFDRAVSALKKKAG
jgi:hypothetical protein